ncbi:hypothetical protein [Nostoc sp.]
MAQSKIQNRSTERSLSPKSKIDSPAALRTVITTNRPIPHAIAVYAGR